MAFTADYIISDDRGNELQRITSIPVGTIISHRQSTELFVELTLTQESPFPEGGYVIAYVVKDSVSGESFEITKNITIASDTVATAPTERSSSANPSDQFISNLANSSASMRLQANA